jgi:signal transduction histidine kinase
MSPLRRALLALGVAGVALGAAVAAVTATSDHTELRGPITALGLLVAWSFLGTGLYAWDQRPDNLTGPLMVGIGFTWLIGGLSASDVPALYVGGSLVNGVPFAILVHLLFAFPSGRLTRGADRAFVGLGYFVTTVLPPIGIVFFDPAVSDDCASCPSNPLLISANEDVFKALVVVQAALAAVVLGALIWDLLQRWRAAADDPAQLVRDAPVWWAGAATLLFVLLVLATNPLPEDGNLDDYLFAAALVPLATVPYAFWLGLIRSRLWRAAVELQESRARIAEAGYAERRRVERDLHDGAQQRLVALALELQVVRSKLDTDPGAAAELLESAANELTGATQELRELARGLVPPVLADRGLVPALEVLANRSPVPVAVEADGTERTSEAVEAAAYFFVSEALTNVARHAGAQRAVVRVARHEDRLCLEVEDDGTGGADVAAGSGLRGLADRIGALGGSLEVDSAAGGGTTLRARLPVAP